MDRQRRAPALTALSRARAAARSLSCVLSLIVAFVALAPGCSNKKELARQKAELTKDLEQFKAHVGDLQKQVSGVRARLDKLPEDLPGTGMVRDDLHALEEGIGVEDGRTKWLAGELEKAFASGKKEEIEKVGKAIPRGDDGTAQAIVKLAHELLPFERLAEQRHFFEKLDAERERELREQPKRR